MNKKSLPLVSIVIPVFNCEDYISETINSILNQKYSNIECIVVNDGSTDSTWNKISEFGDKIVAYTISNSGQSSALNYGFDRAHGDYIGYLSADDLIDSSHIGDMVDLIHSVSENNDNVVAFSRYRLIDSNGVRFGNISDTFKGERDYVEEFNNLIGPGAIFSRSLISKNGGWDTRFKQIPDYVFWFKNMSSARFYQSNSVSASFRVHDASQTYASPSESKADESIQLLNIIAIGELLMPDGMEFKKLSVSSLIYSSCLHIRGGRYKVAFNRWCSAVTLSQRYTLRTKNFKRLLSNIYHVLFKKGV